MSHLQQKQAKLSTVLVRDNADPSGSKDTKDLGPLPVGAKALLGAVGAVWVLILLYLTQNTIRTRLRADAKNAKKITVRY